MISSLPVSFPVVNHSGVPASRRAAAAARTATRSASLSQLLHVMPRRRPDGFPSGSPRGFDDRSGLCGQGSGACAPVASAPGDREPPWLGGELDAELSDVAVGVNQVAAGAAAERLVRAAVHRQAKSEPLLAALGSIRLRGGERGSQTFLARSRSIPSCRTPPGSPLVNGTP